MAYAIIIYLNVIVPQLLDNSGLLRYLWDNSGGGQIVIFPFIHATTPKLLNLGFIPGLI